MDQPKPTNPPPAKEMDEEAKKKAEEKKKQKEAEKEAKLAKIKEKEAKQKAEKEKELANKDKKEQERLKKEADDKEKQLKEQQKLKEYLEVILKTPKGQKKDFGGQELFPNYHPNAVESVWYDYWNDQGFFSPEKQMEIQKHVQKDQKFVIVIPPPNVTGSLHLGHALGSSIQDSLIRYKRMKGEVSLWVPGTDHAGIATQVVVEKKIWRESQKTRHDIGREAFIKKVWEWKQLYGTKIQGQLKKMGCSLDWSREVFTMDDIRTDAVNAAFIKMFNDGLITRATRLVNWSCALKTAISDIEVEFKDLEKHTKLKVPGHSGEYDFGVMFEFSYPVEGMENTYLNVATTRIETMLADTAVAVNSKDDRYKHLHGKNIIHPLNGRRIPIIIDDELVILGLGTGAVKVTPAHDPYDYECGIRNKLQMINLFTDEGLINENGGEEFKGLKRFDARNKVIEALTKKGLYKGMTDNKMRIGFCSRSKDVIEPMIKPQWYVNCNDMAAKACKAVTDGELNILPETQKATWFRWLESIKDWCVSRQLWWGHRIPAYHVHVKGVENNIYDTTQWVVGLNQEDAISNALKKYNINRDQIISVDQDPDVLDTWFSSGLFPFSVFGWPNQTSDLSNYYPTTLLETGADILFFWVARMVMMGQHLTGKLPFNTVFLHSIVRDAHGRKMSKSLGNVTDPSDVILGISLDGLLQKLGEGNLDPSEVEKAAKGIKQDFPNGIAECGTDAMRFALCAYTSQKGDINLDINRVVAYRHFCNKIWNATRFALIKLENYAPPKFNADSLIKDTNAINIWILNAAQRAITQAEEGFKNYDFSQVTTAIYTFWLNELCDVYLETTKPIFSSQDESDKDIKEKTKETLYTCIDIGLRLIHPFMPYISEELYQTIPRRPEEQWIPTIMYAQYPLSQPQWNNTHIEEEMNQCREIIHTIRSLKTTYNVPNTKKINSFIQVRSKEKFDLFTPHCKFIQVLSFSDNTSIILDQEIPSGYIGNAASEHSAGVCLLAKDLTENFDFKQEIDRLQVKLNDATSKKEILLKKMNIPDYSKVPVKVQQDNDNKLKSFNDELSNLIKSMESIKNLIN